MYTVDNIYTNEIEIQKSKFICRLYPLSNIDDVNIYLEKVKKEYKGATHYCYAYILDAYQKYSDDKEPNGTAGIPLLTVLKRNDLNKVLVVVIRYFGGIKLGTGGLLRAYTKAITDCLSLAIIKELTESITLTMKASYENLSKIYNLIGNYITEKNFDDDIKITIQMPLKEYEQIKDVLDNLTKKDG